MNFLSHSSYDLFSVINTLLPFSSENEDKVVNPGILAACKEKYPHLLSHQGFKALQLISESFGDDLWRGISLNFDVSFLQITLDYELLVARGFVHRSFELHILSFIMGIEYPNPID
ncbi:hypothetical protein Tco_0899416 [Tanacetum coccineum]